MPAVAAAGTYTVTSPVAIPAAQTGTLRVMMDGHPAGDVTTAGTFTDRLPVKSAFRDFAISGTLTPRRHVVDIAKCDVCHGTLSLHGANRNDEPGACVVCHNPNATDKARRTGTGVDGKAEEAIDFKTMIHGIHAGQKSNGGFREKGLVVYGFGGSVNDFSKVVFPGKLSNCTACHTIASYQLTGAWTSPKQNLTLRIRIKSMDSDATPWDWSGGGGPSEGDSITFKSKTYKITSVRDVLGKLLALSRGSQCVMIQLEYQNFMDTLWKLAKLKRQDATKALNEAGKTFTRYAMRFTPPFPARGRDSMALEGPM